MTRKICILLGLLVAFVSFLYMPAAQTQEKKWKKTVTLPDGEVILDISGEWDVLVENYGAWSGFGSYPQKESITLEGSAFVGTRMISDPYNTEQVTWWNPEVGMWIKRIETRTVKHRAGPGTREYQLVSQNIPK